MSPLVYDGPHRMQGKCGSYDQYIYTYDRLDQTWTGRGRAWTERGHAGQNHWTPTGTMGAMSVQKCAGVRAQQELLLS
eukprot:43581-Eustigmatos_ZCMA.PRE.1